jgi:hypothetical protein
MHRLWALFAKLAYFSSFNPINEVSLWKHKSAVKLSKKLQNAQDSLTVFLEKTSPIAESDTSTGDI